MKFLFALLALCSCTLPLCSQETGSRYDSALARKLGADDYGMKNYVLVMLKTGSAEVTEKTIRDSLFAGHFANINRLAEEGKLVVAGPLAKNDRTYRGLFILNAGTFEEAAEMLVGDPAIVARLFEPEYYKWYGSAALSEYLKIHEKIELKKP